MRHFQYRIRERVCYNGQKEYVVEWRDDWFGTGIFWLSSWYICRDKDPEIAHFRYLIFDTLDEARAYRDKRKARDERWEGEKIANEKTVE